MSPHINLQSMRARKARLARRLNRGGQGVLWTCAVALLMAGAYCLFANISTRLAYGSFFVSIACIMVAWWHRDALRHLPITKHHESLDGTMEAGLLASLKQPLRVASLWNASTSQPEGVFLCNHLLIDTQLFGRVIETTADDTLQSVWQEALKLLDQVADSELHAGHMAAAILITTPELQPVLTAGKIRREDIVETLRWLQRQRAYAHQPKPFFGGIGRDWAAGFTPHLEEFGTNVSHQVQRGSGLMPVLPHATLLPHVASLLGQGSAVALIGPEGVGKSSLVQGLAHHLLEGKDPSLQYYQIINLHASLILSASSQQLENRMLSLFGEAIAAGNCIVYLEDAHLFFGSGVGAFDMSQVLLPVMRNRRLRLIASFTPGDWQTLQAQQPALTTSFSALTVPEPNEQQTLQVAEDMAIALEVQSRQLISFEAIREAYRLSGQFMQEEAYPGKVIRLLEQSTTYADPPGVITAQSVQAVIEQSRGIRVSEAAEPEATMLLHLEEHIHQRMVGQTRAVEVVSAALRRGRAGVSSPNRPIGSFLFLGPTGVGKTELARSLAATYFGDEQQMIRLDMSEYQRPEDVSRLLAAGNGQEHSLIFAIRQQPFSVVLFDEIEKANPAVLDLFLQLLDEGKVTDSMGNPASFRSSIIIVTSNAGAPDITARVQAGESLADFERPLIDTLIANGQFKPELINRFDEVVLFSPLGHEELTTIAKGMIEGVNQTLAPKQIRVELTPEALDAIVEKGYDPAFGARPMRRVIQKTVENAISVKILDGSAAPGSVITLSLEDIVKRV